LVDAEDLIVRFIGYDLLSGIAREIGSAIRGLADDFATHGNAMSRHMITAGEGIATAGAAMIGIAAAVGAAIYATARQAADFESNLVTLVTQARMGGEGFGSIQGAVDNLRQGILNMAPGSGFGPVELSNAIYGIISVGFRGGQALDILHQAAIGAAVGHADLTKTADILAGVLSSYARTGLSAADAMGILDATVGVGKMRMEDLVGAMSNGILPVAQQSGLSLESLGAALATMTDNLIPPSRAMTYLRSALIQITTPSGPATKALEAIGLAGTDVAQRMGFFNEVLARAGVNQSEVAQKLQETGSLSAVVHLLDDRLKAAGLNAQESGALISKAFGGIRSGTGMVTLYNQLDRLDQKTGLIHGNIHRMADNFDYMVAHDPAFAMKNLHGTINTLTTSIGEAFVPVLFRIADAMVRITGPLLGWIRNHQDLVQKVGVSLVIFFGFFGAILVIVGGLMMLAGFIAGAFTPMMILILAIGTLASMAVQSHGRMGPFLKHVQDLGLPLEKIGRHIMDLIVPAFTTFGALALSAGDSLVKMLLPPLRWLGDHGDVVKAALMGVAFYFALAAIHGTAMAIAGWAVAAAELAALWPIALIVVGLILLGAAIYLVIAHWKEINRWLIQVGDTITGYLVGAWNALVTAVSGAWASVVGSVGRGAGSIGTFFTDIYNSIVRWINNTNKGISDWVNGVINNIRRVFDGVSSWITRMNQVVEHGWSEFARRPGYWLGYLVGFVLGTIYRIELAIGDWIISMATKGAAAIGGFLTHIVREMTALPGRFASWLGDAISHVEKFVLDMATHAATAATSFITNVTTWMSQAPGRFAGWLGDVAGRVVRWVGNMEQQALQVGANFIANVSNFISQLPGRIERWVADIIAQVTNFASSMATLAGRAGNDFVSWLISAIQVLPGRVWTIGTDIARGLVNGIKSMGDWVKGQAAGFVQGIVEGMKHAVGAASPSRLTAEVVGAPMMQGIGVGIEREVMPMHDTLSRALDAIMPPDPAGLGNRFGGRVPVAPTILTPTVTVAPPNPQLDRIATAVEALVALVRDEGSQASASASNLSDLFRQMLYNSTEAAYSLRRAGVRSGS
jgi:TP901 family phage tail tape measure protein